MDSNFCCAQHRHSIFCMVPPHVLREIIKRGNKSQQDAALNTLAQDSTQRTRRVTSQLLAPRPRSAMTVTAAQPQRSIYTTNHTENLPGTLVRSEGQGSVQDPAVNEAYDGLGKT